jgi:hypothetical protein
MKIVRLIIWREGSVRKEIWERDIYVVGDLGFVIDDNKNLRIFQNGNLICVYAQGTWKRVDAETE